MNSSGKSLSTIEQDKSRTYPVFHSAYENGGERRDWVPGWYWLPTPCRFAFDPLLIA